MSLSDAITDLQATIEAVDGVGYANEEREKSTRAHEVFLTVGGLERVDYFGSADLTQSLQVVYKVKDATDHAAVSSKQDAILSAIITDRRRGGSAQTTIVGQWDTEENNGRQGASYVLDVLVKTHETAPPANINLDFSELTNSQYIPLIV